MKHDVYLNERSFEASCTSRREAVQLFEDLFLLLRALDRRLGGVSVVAHQRLTGIAIGPHPVAIWYAQDKERIRRVKLIASRAPFDGEYEAVKESLEGDLEFRHDGREVIGLGLASWHDCLAVSVNRDPWQEVMLTLYRSLIWEQADGSIGQQEGDAFCRHASTEQHLAEHTDWIAAYHVDSPRTPDELWQHRDRWYPNILFLARVEREVRDLMAASPSFGQIVRTLAALQRSVLAWNGRGLPDWETLVSGEHEQREELCRFEDVDGRQRLFELHARFTPGAGRIHFRMDGANRRIVLAYIGRKLGI